MTRALAVFVLTAYAVNLAIWIAVTLVQPDPTWTLEWEHFKQLCRRAESNLSNDLWLNQRLNALTAAALAGGRE